MSVEDTDQTNATLSSSKTVVAKSSVNSFISRLNGLDAVSNAILHNFLSHVSCFIEDVYSDVCSDEEGMNLPSCVIECKYSNRFFANSSCIYLEHDLTLRWLLCLCVKVTTC